MPKLCKQRKCKRSVRSRGLCHAHYQSLRIAGRLVTTRKFCDLCNTTGQFGHARSLSHCKMKRFKKLLDQKCITLSEIGRRLGFTREYARQLAKRFEVKGAERVHACTLTRQQQKLEASRFIRRARRVAETREWAIEPIALRQAQINNKTVQFATLARPRGYLSISGSVNPKTDFVVFCDDKTWVVLPVQRCPSGSTYFTETEPMDTRGVGRSKRHDWRQFINAFHLLEA